MRGIETIATYDPSTETFILRTPTESAQKYWIGAAGECATLSTVFAQLVVGETNHGIHAFVVRLRERPFGAPLPGVTIEDCGVKAGLNGVDNGRIWFDSVRVPREDMLCRSSTVAPDGTFRSDAESPDARFGAALAALTGGRVSIAVNAIEAVKIGLTIAVRYGRSRRAFAPSPGKQETALLDYKSHQRRLMPSLAAAYVYSLCGADLGAQWAHCVRSGTVSKNVHVLSAGFKALFTWFMSDALQHARECCGGQGYKSENRICVMRADRDVMLTFEGANDVMMQQVSRALLAEFVKTGNMLDDGGPDAAAALDQASPTAPALITSATFIRRCFLDREVKLVHALAARVAAETKAGGTPFDAWNSALNVASEAGTAHMHRRMWDMHVAHVASVAAAGDDSSMAALKLCGEMWALSVIDSDSSFVRLGSVDFRQATSIHDVVELLYGRMASIADVLVDGFEIPAHLLAPIAFDYVAHNARARM